MVDNYKDWHSDIYDVLRQQNIKQVCHVPDAGHASLIQKCEADNGMTVVSLTTEEDGIGVLTGAWLGGQRVSSAWLAGLTDRSRGWGWVAMAGG